MVIRKRGEQQRPPIQLKCGHQLIAFLWWTGPVIGLVKKDVGGGGGGRGMEGQGRDTRISSEIPGQNVSPDLMIVINIIRMLLISTECDAVLQIPTTHHHAHINPIQDCINYSVVIIITINIV